MVECSLVQESMVLCEIIQDEVSDSMLFKKYGFILGYTVSVS